MSPPDNPENFTRVLRRGRLTLALSALLVAVSGAVIISRILATRGSQWSWRLALGAVLILALLRALYRGYDLARWLTFCGGLC